MIGKSIVVRGIEGFSNAKVRFQSGQNYEVEFDTAALAVARGEVEPLLSINDHNPGFAGDQVSFRQAFDLYVSQHPDILKQGGLSRSYPKVKVKPVLDSPIWHRRPSGNVGRRMARSSGGHRDATGSSQNAFYGEPRAGPVVIDMGKLRKDLADRILQATERLVVRQFLSRLQSGELVSSGVYEDHLADWSLAPIPKQWWSKDILVKVEAGEISELLGPKPRGDGTRRWSGIHVEMRIPEERTKFDRSHASMAKIGRDLKHWLERTTRRVGRGWTKDQYYEAARDEFGPELTRNKFNEVWRQADIPSACKLSGRRGKIR